MKTQSKEMQTQQTPETALELLKNGNKRFLASSPSPRDLLIQAKDTAAGQFPFAVVLSCIDSRASAELIFDQGIGDIFSIRIAGNVINEDILGSMEFGCELAGSLLIVVLGHSSCGAIRGACDGVELGHLTGLLKKIEPAMERVIHNEENSFSSYLQRISEANVDVVVEQIRARSEVLRSLLSKGKIGIVGAMYSVETGVVTFGELEPR